MSAPVIRSSNGPRSRREGPDATLDASRVSRAEALARRLEMEITTQALAAGDRLGTKRDLRQRFGVGVATVNEAVRLMEMRGLVAARPGPGGGLFVGSVLDRARMTHTILGLDWEQATLRDCLALRNALEPAVCSAAAVACTPEDAADLDKLVDAMAETLASPEEYLAANWALHRRIARICPGAPLRTVYLAVIDFLDAGLGDFEFEGPLSKDVEIHRALCAAVVAGDEPELRQALERHKENSPLE